MASYPQDFPFGIMDVVELLHLKIRRRQANSVYVDCPFCGDRRGKMNVNFVKNVWRCNYCDEHGGMLMLYAKLNHTTNSDAFREICDALQTGDASWVYAASDQQRSGSGKDSFSGTGTSGHHRWWYGGIPAAPPGQYTGNPPDVVPVVWNAVADTIPPGAPPFGKTRING